MTSPSLPLCVDLDETLILCDTFRLGLKQALKKPHLLPLLLVKLAIGGRPAAKHWLGETFPLDAAALPYRTALIDYLKKEKANGRKIYLVSAASQNIVDAVAGYVGLFDAAFGSGKDNLKGARKAAFIMEKIGIDFCYAGDSFADLAVWNKAKAAILCGPKAATLRALLHREVEAVFDHPDQHHSRAFCQADVPGPRAR